MVDVEWDLLQLVLKWIVFFEAMYQSTSERAETVSEVPTALAIS